jgi:hypothetical protein
MRETLATFRQPARSTPRHFWLRSLRLADDQVVRNTHLTTERHIVTKMTLQKAHWATMMQWRPIVTLCRI